MATEQSTPLAKYIIAKLCKN